jgi:hypothetical protein
MSIRFQRTANRIVAGFENRAQDCGPFVTQQSTFSGHISPGVNINNRSSDIFKDVANGKVDFV